MKPPKPSEAFAPIYLEEIKRLEKAVKVLRRQLATEKVRYDELDDSFRRLGKLIYSGIGGN